MKIKIVADSSCDMTKEMKKETGIELVPLTLRLEDREYVDDENLDIRHYLAEMNASRIPPKTASPTPYDFLEKYKGEGSVFVVTLSSKLSGTYNSAILARNMFLDEVGEKFIHVFDSLSASVAETLISLKIYELAKNNLTDLEIVEEVSKYIKEMKTLFLLESLEHLAKAGRLHPIIAKAATALSIKPIMGADEEGNIKLVEKIMGYKKAFRRLVERIGEEGSALEQKVLGISHCNCLDRALQFKAEVQKKYNFKDVVIVEMAGLSSTYADDGGIIIAF